MAIYYIGPGQTYETFTAMEPRPFLIKTVIRIWDDAMAMWAVGIRSEI